MHCDKCNEDHEIQNFYVCNNKSKLANGEYKVYTVYRCKIYVNKQQKEYTCKNKGTILEKKKIYYEENKDICRKKNTIYRKENKEKIQDVKKVHYNANKIQIREKQKKYLKTIRGFMICIINRCSKIDKKKNRKCDLSVEYLEELFEKQDYKCYFCSNVLDVECGDAKLSQASLDRIDNDLGHVEGNVNWTCLFCNNAKNKMSEDMYKLFLNTLVGKNQICDTNYIKDKRYITKLYDSLRSCDRKKFPLDISITKEQIEEMINLQNNKCAITGLPLISTAKYLFPFKPSVDRINNGKGHIINNCQIVCLAVQLGKSTHSNEIIKEYIKRIRDTNN